MNIVTMKQELSIIRNYLNSGSKEALKGMLETFQSSYKIVLFSNLDPFDKKNG